MNTKKVYVYARVSTADQNPQMQLDGLRDYAGQRGWVIAGEYIDHGVSGTKDRRPQLDELMTNVRRGKLRGGVVLVFKFDRFARSVKHLVTALDEFRSLGIDFVSLHDSIDTSTPTGRFTYAITAAFAEMETELIRLRVRSGLDAARRRGKHVGRPKVRVDVEWARELRGQGMSYAAVARLVGVGVGTLHAALREPPQEVPVAGS